MNTIKVFIENEAGSNQKHIFNEKTQEFIKTVTVSRSYPYPYGFILGTTSGDGDNLDCFIITKRLLKSGQIVEVEPIGLMEQVDNGEEDNNVLATFPGDSITITHDIEQVLTKFVNHVFDHLPEKVVSVGRFLDRIAAEAAIEQSIDSE